MSPFHYLIFNHHAIAAKCEDELEVSQTVARQEGVYETGESLSALSIRPML